MITPLYLVSNNVLFPKTPIPLHVFEEHNKTMIRDAMVGDRKLTVALLKGEVEDEYAGIDSVHEIACLGRIETFEELEDGDYDIVVVGLRRVRIVHETQQFPYLMAKIEDVRDIDRDEGSDALIVRHDRISGLFARFIELATDGNRDVGKAMPQMEFELLVNTVAMTLNITTEQKQGLLEMDDAFQRCDMLNAILQQHIETLDIIRRFEHLKPDIPHFN